MESRILALSDSFEAMISQRPYREAMSIEEAIVEIKKNKGFQFDPELADIFIGIIGSQEEKRAA